MAVVNEAFVKRFFKAGEDPLDQHFGLDYPENAGTFRIVGVVRDAKFAGWGLNQPARPMFYVPLAQTVDYTADLMKRIELQSHFIGGMMLVTHARRPARSSRCSRKALAEVDPNLTITSVQDDAEQQVALSFDQERAVAEPGRSVRHRRARARRRWDCTASRRTVAQRTGEIGIRMALGADRLRVVGLVLRSAFRRVVFGLDARRAAGCSAPDA